MAQTFNTILSFVKSTSRKDRRKGIGSLSVSAVAGGGVGNIADSATQAWVRNNFVDKTTEQEITAPKIFSQGIKIGDVPLFKHPDGYVYLDETLVLKGGVVMFGNSSGVDVPSIFDSLPIDGRTIKRDGNGALYVDETALSISGGGGGGGVADSVHWNNVTGKPSWIGSTKPTYKYSEIEERPDLSVYFLASNFTKANIKSTLGISDWALASAKPTYKYSEISNTPDLSVYALNTDLAKKWTQNDAKIANWDSAYSWGNHAAAGYAKASDVTNEFKNYVKLAGDAQSITAQHNFINGLKIGGLSLRKVDNYLYLDSSLVLSGGVTMYGDDGTTVKPIWESIPLDDSTLAWVNGELTVIGGTSGSGGGISEEFLNVTLQGYQPKITSNNKLAYSLISGTPDLSVYAKKTDIPSLSDYATQSWVSNNYLSKSGGTMTGSITTRSNVYSWANAKTVGHIIAGHTPGEGFAPIISTGLQSGGYGKLGQHSDRFGLYAYSAESTLPKLRIELYPDGGYINIVGPTYPESQSTYDLGASDRKWKNVYATSFIGNLTGNADTATAADKMTPEYLTDLNNATPWRFFDMKTGYGSTDGNKPNAAWVSGITGMVAAASTYRWQLAGTSGNNRPYFRREHNGTWSAWSTLAFTSDIPTKLSQLTDDVVVGKYLPLTGGTLTGNLTAPTFVGNLTGNAISATKLATARTIWGNVFDGSASISGNIIGKVPEWYIISGEQNIIRIATAGTIITPYNKESGWVAMRTGDETATNGSKEIRLLSSGNVAIGGTTASAKLHVHGTAKFTGDTTFSSKVVIGTIPVYQSADGTLFVDANVVFRGGVAMYGDTTTTVNEE